MNWGKSGGESEGWASRDGGCEEASRRTRWHPPSRARPGRPPSLSSKVYSAVYSRIQRREVFECPSPRRSPLVVLGGRLAARATARLGPFPFCAQGAPSSFSLAAPGRPRTAQTLSPPPASRQFHPLGSYSCPSLAHVRLCFLSSTPSISSACSCSISPRVQAHPRLPSRNTLAQHREPPHHAASPAARSWPGLERETRRPLPRPPMDLQRSSAAAAAGRKQWPLP